MRLRAARVCWYHGNCVQQPHPNGGLFDLQAHRRQRRRYGVWRPPHASACLGQERGIAAFQLGPPGRDPGRTPWTIPTSASTWLLVTVTPVSRRSRHLSLLQSVQTLPPAPAEVLLARTSLNLSSHAMLSGRVSDISPSFAFFCLHCLLQSCVQWWKSQSPRRRVIHPLRGGWGPSLRRA